MLILISDAFDPGLPDRLAKFGEVTSDKGRLAEADVVLIRSKTKATREYIDGAPRMKLIIRGGVGTDNIDKPYAAEKGIVVRNTPKASSIAVGELAFALMLSVPNHIVRGHAGLVDGKWLKKELKRTELYGKTLCLIGIGNIAQVVASRAKAFGMTVQAYDPYVESSPAAQMKPTLSEALAGADYVSLHTPLTDETAGMINADTIGQMKDGVVVINTGRGKCVDAEDMVAALGSGKVGAYATDVWPSDPPPPNYPILKAPNVVMLPHLGASSKENLLRIGDEVEAIISELKEGGKL
jgi:D-3-phosphoglycerate dehydrogenase / 2-oxoglutarate reductase